MFPRKPICLIFGLLAFAVFAAACASSDPLDTSESAAARRDWRPSAAGLGDWVWIRLKSDEWLKGEIIVLRNESLQFDSDKLGKLTIDWDDVREVYSRRKTDILRDDNQRVTGAISIADNVVTVTDEGGERHVFPRNELRSIVPTARRTADLWAGKVSAGLGYRAGNTDQKDASVDINLTRRTIDTRYQFRFLGNYSEANDDVIVNSSRMNTQFDIYLTWQLFFTPASLEIYRDPIVNIAWQITPGVGVGYTVVDESDIMWEITTGVGYQYTEYDSVEVGQDETEGRTSLSLGTSFEYEITANLDFEFDYNLTLGMPDTESRQHHLLSRLSFEVTNDIDFDVTFIWDRNDPAVADSDGNRPEPNDIYVTLGLGIDF